MEPTLLLFGFFTSLLASIYQNSLVHSSNSPLSMVFYAVLNSFVCALWPTFYCIAGVVVLILTQLAAHLLSRINK